MEDLTRATMKKLTQGMAEHNKAMAAAKSDEAKGTIVSFLGCLFSFVVLTVKIFFLPL